MAAQTNSSTSRRTFLQFISAAFFALFTFPATWARAKAVALGLDKAKGLEKVHGSATVKIKGHKILLVRDSEKSVRAINPQCTHKKCTVEYSGKTGHLHCPCHKSAYDLKGTVLDGPAPKPLQTYKSALRGEKILIKLPD